MKKKKRPSIWWNDFSCHWVLLEPLNIKTSKNRVSLLVLYCALHFHLWQMWCSNQDDDMLMICSSSNRMCHFSHLFQKLALLSKLLSLWRISAKRKGRRKTSLTCGRKQRKAKVNVLSSMASAQKTFFHVKTLVWTYIFEYFKGASSRSTSFTLLRSANNSQSNSRLSSLASADHFKTLRITH